MPHRATAAAMILLAASIAAAQEKQPAVKWNNPVAPKAAGVEHRSFSSKSMDVEVGYCVWTPPGYAASKENYPVVYFLHGSGGNENSDVGFSGMLAAAIRAKQAPPVICVFPNGGLSDYKDRPEAKVMGETLVVKELIPLIDKEFRTVAKREGRVVCGFSMGGGGAVRLAVKHPDLFSAAGSWAGAFPRRDAKAGPDDAAALAEKNLGKVKGKVRLLLIAGDQDLTFDWNKALAERFKELGVPHEFKVLEGVGHNLGAYYEKTGDELVRFLTRDFPKPQR